MQEIVASEPISRFARCSAVVFLLLQVANGLPLCGFKDPLPLLHPRVQLGFTLEGKPLPGASVELYWGRPSPTNDLPYETSVTGSGGITVTSELPVATFHIRVLSRDHQIADFTLDAPIEKELHAIEGKFELLVTPLAPVEDSESCCAEVCSAAGAKALQAELRDLRGVVMDRSGAVIPKAKIEVYQSEDGKQAIAHLATDHAGLFASDLAPGKYLVIFKACGFDDQKVVVTVGPAGWRGMQVSLAIASCRRLLPGNESSIAALKQDSSENR